MPAWWSASTRYMKSCGVPKREVGAKNPVDWYPHEPANGYSATGRSSTCVKCICRAYCASAPAASR